MVVTWSAEKYAPVGHCIYCGATDNLSDEHIIPFGLQPKGGDWFLPEASCIDCAKITTGYEGICQQAMLGPLRYKLGLKTRRKKEPTFDVTFNYREDGRLEDKELALDQFPLACLGFKWPASGLLRGITPNDKFEGECIVRYPKGEIERFVKDGEGFKIGRVGPLAFARMLAKIGHAYAIAKYGESSFRPLLPDLIRCKSDTAPFLIGGDESGVPLVEQPGILHDVYRIDCKTDDVEYLLVAIRLFAFMGMPRYIVVVGKKR